MTFWLKLLKNGGGNEMDVMWEAIIPLLVACGMDYVWGDPLWLPHPVVGFGKLIAYGEKHLNKGEGRRRKGAILTLMLVCFVFFSTSLVLHGLETVSWVLKTAASIILIFYCLAGTTLIREVKMVFNAVDQSLEAGRKQVSRIVGRDTSELSEQEVRTAALETLAENLSDGVIAPLFWLLLLGVPGMLAYKMVNTLDSMIGYRNERYREFGCFAARLDDVANYIPARLTALFMLLAAMCTRGQNGATLARFILKYGKAHASPNSGYPEAALAGALNCRFGGPHPYFGEIVTKPYIGSNPRLLNTDDMHFAIGINRLAEVFMILGVIGIMLLVTKVTL